MRRGALCAACARRQYCVPARDLRASLSRAAAQTLAIAALSPSACLPLVLVRSLRPVAHARGTADLSATEGRRRCSDLRARVTGRWAESGKEGGGSSPVAHGVLRRTHLAALRPRRPPRARTHLAARARAARSTLLYVGVRHDSRRAAAVARGRRRQTIWKQHAVVVIRQEGRRRATPRALARGAEEAIALSAERSTAFPSAPAAPSSRAAELH